MRYLIRRLLGVSANATVFCECRHCGTTVEPTVEHCPACETGDICRYELH